MLLELIGLEAARARGALVNHLAVLADQVEAVGVAPVILRGRILHVIDEHRHGEVQLLRAGAGDLRTLEKILRIIDRSPGRQRTLAIDRMGFTNVDDEESCRLAILAVKFFQAPGLAGKRRSCVAAEDQDHRLLVLVPGQVDLSLVIRLHEIRRR